MGKSFKARKKARANTGRRASRSDSTAGVVLSAGTPSEPPPSSESSEAAELSNAGSLPPPSDSLSPTSSEITEQAAASPSEPPKAAAEAPASASRVETHNDTSGEFQTFFAKPEHEIHLEEARREAPELHDEEIIAAPPRRVVHQRARHVVIGVVGVAALIGLAGAVMRKATPRASAATAMQPVEQVQPAVEKPVEPAAPPPIAPPPPPAPPPTTEAPAATPAETAAASASAPLPAESAAPAAPATVSAAVASAAPAADPDDELSGAQLLARARQAIAANAASKAAALAKKAIAKGAGGSAYYVLGAAYQTMGSNGAAKSAYGNCAKSGCAEASECASLLEGM